MQLKTIEDETFRFMDFGENGFASVLSWAEKQEIEPSEAMAVWMVGLGYDLGGISADSLSPETYQKLWGNLMEDYKEPYEEIQTIYAGLIGDLKVFPIPKNSDPDCAFPTYADSWGDPRTFGGDRHHEGCDIMGAAYPDGTYPVLSMTDGVVEKLGWLKLGGWRIGIRSDSGIYYYYAHLDSYADGLQAGDRVTAGQEIGRMGSTGYSTVEGTKGNFAVHLHVGIYIPSDGQEDVSVNPYYLMRYLEHGHVMTAEYAWPDSGTQGEEES